MTLQRQNPNDARMRLYALIELLKKGEMKIGDFCEQFETTYNLEVDKSELDPTESTAFSKLFDKVVWYSPFPDERAEIPSYLGEAEILQAVSDAEKALAAIYEPKPQQPDS